MKCLLCDCPLNLLISFTDLLCLKNKQDLVCLQCHQRFEKISDTHCPRCYKSGIDTICYDCQEWDRKGEVINHISIYRYNSAMKEYFSKYKFQGDYLLRTVFSKDIKQVLRAYKDYTLVPIPLGEKRFEERKFNQVVGFLDAAKLPYQNLLVKKRW